MNTNDKKTIYMNNNISDMLENMGELSKSSLKKLSSCSENSKNTALQEVSSSIDKNRRIILDSNKKDMDNAEKKNLPNSMLDRLFLDDNRVDSMLESIEKIIRLPDPIGTEISRNTQPSGLDIAQIRVPLGVIGIIYESRPNVTVDAGMLCLKSGNSCILRCGSESFNSSRSIVESIHTGLSNSLIPKDAVQLISTTDRTAVKGMLKLNKYIDLIVPRGGKSLVELVQKESNIPTISHLEGLCHTYIDKNADPEMAKNISINAKMRRTGICGATETILYHKESKEIIKNIINALINLKCEIKGDKTTQLIDKRILQASEDDWSTEYLDAMVSIKMVGSVDEAVKHIEKYGSKHTDAIITEDIKAANYFLNKVDSAVVLHNASTQFSDGGEFGMGAEIGISTGKLHARGPVGLKELTSYKYIVRGNGQTRS